LAKVIEAEHSEEFYSSLILAIKSVVTFTEPVIYLFREGLRPIYLYLEVSPRVHETAVETYLDGAYLLDPVFRAIQERRAEGVYALTDIVPSGFRRSQYFRSYYHALRLADEMTFLIYINEKTCVNISLVRRRPDSLFSQSEIERFKTIEPVVCELVKKFMKTNVSFEEDTKSFSSHKLESGVKNLGTSILTGREQEVLQLIIKGYNTHSIALNLGISIDTVKLHRKNIYRKLQVSSASELFSKIIEALIDFPKSAAVDPLVEHYS